MTIPTIRAEFLRLLRKSPYSWGMDKSSESLESDRQAASRDSRTALQGGKDAQATVDEQRRLAGEATTREAKDAHNAAADTAQRVKQKHDADLLRTTGDYLKARDEQHRRGNSLP